MLAPQSTYINRVTTVYVPSSELGLPPLSRKQVCPTPRNQGRRHTLLRVRGWGSPNSDDLRKSFALCILWLALSSQPGGGLGVWVMRDLYRDGSLEGRSVPPATAGAGQWSSLTYCLLQLLIYIFLYIKHWSTLMSCMGIPQGSKSRSTIDERTNLLRFLDIILRVLRLEVSVWISETIGKGVWFSIRFSTFLLTVYNKVA